MVGDFSHDIALPGWPSRSSSGLVRIVSAKKRRFIRLCSICRKQWTRRTSGDHTKQFRDFHSCKSTKRFLAFWPNSKCRSTHSVFDHYIEMLFKYGLLFLTGKSPKMLVVHCKNVIKLNEIVISSFIFQIALLVQNLMSDLPFAMKSDNIHYIGHNIGAHMAKFFADYLFRLSGLRVGRVTGSCRVVSNT